MTDSTNLSCNTSMRPGKSDVEVVGIPPRPAAALESTLQSHEYAVTSAESTHRSQGAVGQKLPATEDDDEQRPAVQLDRCMSAYLLVERTSIAK